MNILKENIKRSGVKNEYINYVCEKSIELGLSEYFETLSKIKEYCWKEVHSECF